MLKIFVKRYKSMILLAIFFFYLGCGITLSFLRTECAEAVSALKHTKSRNKVEYAALILTSPENEAKRDAIRATWVKLANNIFRENGEKLYKWNSTQSEQKIQLGFIKFFFVVGTKTLDKNKLSNLEMENIKNQDLLLLENVEDSYKNLAFKMLHALVWFSDNLKGLKYVIKCDDDSFVRVDLIMRDLEAFAPEMNAPDINDYISYKSSLPLYKGLYWGYFDGRARVYLNGKWQEKEWFLCDNYLPYALGGGYVISHSIVDYIARNTEFLSLYNSEDVSMGVWTAALYGINRVHDNRFDTEWKSRGCNNNMLVRHKQSPSDMFQMYKNLVQSHGERLCDVEITERKSYFYKWNVLPSLCCR